MLNGGVCLFTHSAVPSDHMLERRRSHGWDGGSGSASAALPARLLAARHVVSVIRGGVGDPADVTACQSHFFGRDVLKINGGLSVAFNGSV